MPYWYPVKDGDPRAVALFKRHYSYRKRNYITKARDIMPPGEYICLLTRDCSALFIWVFSKFRKDSQTGVNCSVFRNESNVKSSDLIKEACDIAWIKWPGKRLFTFVNSKKIRSVNPGYCFKQAGWKYCGKSKGGLDILEIGVKK